MVDCCWLKTRSIFFDQVNDGGSFGGVFVSSGVIFTICGVFFSWSFDPRRSAQFFYCGGGRRTDVEASWIEKGGSESRARNTPFTSGDLELGTWSLIWSWSAELDPHYSIDF